MKKSVDNLQFHMHPGTWQSRMSENKPMVENPHVLDRSTSHSLDGLTGSKDGIEMDRRKELRLKFSSNSGISTFGIPLPRYHSRSPNTANANCFGNDHSTSRHPAMSTHEHPKPLRTPEKSREKMGIYGNLHATGRLQVGPSQVYNFTSDDLIDLGEIGRGGFGTVNKMVHHASKTSMAVKRIRSTVDETEQKQLLMDLQVVMNSNECPYIVLFYGALFKEGDCWICMELMDTSLDKFYKYVYDVLNSKIPESILGKISVATVRALNYLKEKLNIIHRDVKPSNILLDRGGNIKLCDFGISGQLVDSIARTRDAGCRPYMAPERIDPQRGKSGYDVRSDIWSLGITLIEVGTGKFPYPKWVSVFEQLYQVVHGEPPTLKNDTDFNFSPEFISFVDTCLIKEENHRPKYNTLLKHTFIRMSETSGINTARYFTDVLDQMFINDSAMFTTNNPA